MKDLKGHVAIDIDYDSTDIIKLHSKMDAHKILVTLSLALVSTVRHCESSGLFESGKAMESAMNIIHKNYVENNIEITVIDKTGGNSAL